MFGPFDVAFLETGAYNTRWEAVHMLPEQTVQAFGDLGGKWLVPIHNGTFDLALHAWSEPLALVTTLSAERNVALSTPRFGERLDISQPAVHRWRARGKAPADRVIYLEHATQGKVTRYQLRPDVFGPAPDAPDQRAA
jgi:hypothetical protein